MKKVKKSNAYVIPLKSEGSKESVLDKGSWKPGKKHPWRLEKPGFSKP